MPHETPYTHRPQDSHLSYLDTCLPSKDLDSGSSDSLPENPIHYPQASEDSAEIKPLISYLINQEPNKNKQQVVTHLIQTLGTSNFNAPSILTLINQYKSINNGQPNFNTLDTSTLSVKSLETFLDACSDIFEGDNIDQKNTLSYILIDAFIKNSDYSFEQRTEVALTLKEYDSSLYLNSIYILLEKSKNSLTDIRIKTYIAVDLLYSDLSIKYRSFALSLIESFSKNTFISLELRVNAALTLYFKDESISLNLLTEVYQSSKKDIDGCIKLGNTILNKRLQCHPEALNILHDLALKTNIYNQYAEETLTYCKKILKQKVLLNENQIIDIQNILYSLIINQDLHIDFRNQAIKQLSKEDQKKAIHGAISIIYNHSLSKPNRISTATQIIESGLKKELSTLLNNKVGNTESSIKKAQEIHEIISTAIFTHHQNNFLPEDPAFLRALPFITSHITPYRRHTLLIQKQAIPAYCKPIQIKPNLNPVRLNIDLFHPQDLPPITKHYTHAEFLALIKTLDTENRKGSIQRNLIKQYLVTKSIQSTTLTESFFPDLYNSPKPKNPDDLRASFLLIAQSTLIQNLEQPSSKSTLLHCLQIALKSNDQTDPNDPHKLTSKEYLLLKILATLEEHSQSLSQDRNEALLKVIIPNDQELTLFHQEKHPNRIPTSKINSTKIYKEVVHIFEKHKPQSLAYASIRKISEIKKVITEKISIGELLEAGQKDSLKTLLESSTQSPNIYNTILQKYIHKIQTMKNQRIDELSSSSNNDNFESEISIKEDHKLILNLLANILECTQGIKSTLLHFKSFAFDELVISPSPQSLPSALTQDLQASMQSISKKITEDLIYKEGPLYEDLIAHPHTEGIPEFPHQSLWVLNLLGPILNLIPYDDTQFDHNSQVLDKKLISYSKADLLTKFSFHFLIKLSETINNLLASNQHITYLQLEKLLGAEKLKQYDKNNSALSLMTYQLSDEGIIALLSKLRWISTP